MIKNGNDDSRSRWPKVAGVAVFVALALGTLYWGYLRTLPPSASTAGGAWYFDPSTQKLFAGSVNDISPVDSPSGGPGYRAYVFACGGCAEATPADIVYLGRAPDEVVKSRDARIHGGKPTLSPTMMIQRAQQDSEVAAIAHPNDWVTAASEEGHAITAVAATRCDGQPAKECLPLK